MAIAWRTSFEIPLVNDVHTVIHAFLRTSEYGGWEANGDLASDVFVLNYRRGKPVPPPPGKFSHFVLGGVGSDYAEHLRKSGWGKCPAMELTVRLRPMPASNTVKVALEYRLVGQHAGLIARTNRSVGDTIERETGALVQYVMDSYGFPQLPEIIVE